MKNKVLNIDCLEGMKKINDSSVNLIYLDPPFFTQKVQKLKDKNLTEFSYSDKWNDIKDYLENIKVRLIEMKRILSTDGNIFLHCDTKASHYLRVLMDEVFGYNNFRSEIIWHYKRWSNSKKGLLNNHQVIFWYSKSKEYKFNIKYVDYSPTTNLDQILQDRMRDENGKTIYKKDENGKIKLGKEKKGVPLSDVWSIPILNPKAKERVGYPTQKPLLLLEEIIKLASDEDDIILDPFCGSGTTLVAAKLNNRNYIGMDLNQEAIPIINNRLETLIKTESHLLKKGISHYKTKTEDELNILKYYNSDVVQRNKGLDGILKNEVNNSKIGIKIQKESETLLESLKLLRVAMNKKEMKFSILVRLKNEIITDKELVDGIKIVDHPKLMLEQNESFFLG